MFLLFFLIGIATAETFAVTGCAGYIGSHMTLKLLEQGHRVVGMDNLSRGSVELLHVLQTFPLFTFYKLDLGNTRAINVVFQTHPDITTIFHFAAVAFPAESVQYPELYRQNITDNTRNVVDMMLLHSIKTLVYSSTCAVYGAPTTFPITENTETDTISPYGKYKLEAERYIQTKTGPSFRAHILRYFNVVGAEITGRLGEIPRDTLTKYGRIWTSVVDTIYEKRECVSIYETTLATPDGTAVRDYIHVSDLVDAHIAVLQVEDSHVWNVANGNAVSVFDFIDAAQRACKHKIPVCIENKSIGFSPPYLRASSQKLTTMTGWTPKHTSIQFMLATSWKSITYRMRKKSQQMYKNVTNRLKEMKKVCASENLPIWVQFAHRWKSEADRYIDIITGTRSGNSVRATLELKSLYESLNFLNYNSSVRR